MPNRLMNPAEAIREITRWSNDWLKDRHPGLHCPPEAGEVYQTHQAWAGAQQPTTKGFMALGLVTLNPAVHRCRIGKITLKQASHVQ